LIPTTDSGLTLTLSKLLRDQLFRPGCAWSGSLIWTNTSTGERIGSIGYEAHLGEDKGRVRLRYTTTRRDGEKRESDYWTRDNAPTLGRPAMVVYMPTDRRLCGETLSAQRRLHLRLAPSPSACLPLPARTRPRPGFAARFQATWQARGGGWHRRLRSETEVAKQLMTASSKKSSPPRRSSKPTWRSSTASSIGYRDANSTALTGQSPCRPVPGRAAAVNSHHKIRQPPET
jgi:hypothetical protein